MSNLAPRQVIGIRYQNAQILTESDDEHAVVDARLGAEEAPGVGDAAEVELHGVGVDADGDGAPLDEELGDLGLVGGQGDGGVDGDADLGAVEVTALVAAVVVVGLLGLQD